MYSRRVRTSRLHALSALAVRFDDEEDDDDVNGSVDEYVSDDDDAPATLSKNKESIESITDDSD